MRNEEVMEQIEEIYNSEYKSQLNKIILIKNNEILKEYRQK